MASVLCKGGSVFDGERFFFADILIDAGRVVRIEPQILQSADDVLDATGKLVLPGLVDAHVHMKGISADSIGISADMSCLPFGVTAAADAAGVLGDRARLDGFDVKNVVFVCARIRGDHAHFENALQMLQKYGDKAVGIKIYFDASDSEVRSIAPLCETVHFAAQHGLKVMVHSTHSPIPMPELLAALRNGDILTHAYHGGEHNASEDDFRCIKDAKARGVVIDAGLAGHIHTDFAIFQRAIACGAYPDIISSDITSLSAYKRGGRYGLPMCMSIARHLGMSEKDIFQAVTSTPARALGKQNTWGRLAVGRVADVCVLEYTNEPFDLTDRAGARIVSKTGYRCVLTVSNGEILYRN